MRLLNGNVVFCRPGTTDAAVLGDTFLGRYHLPPDDIMPHTILDLGSNIGLTMAHFAAAYPMARILGIELDAGNVELCRLNIAPYSDRCEIQLGAVWSRTGLLGYTGHEEWGFRVSESPEPGRSVQAHTMGDLIERLGGTVDYVKMDIEGAEEAILAAPEAWIKKVRCLKIEVHTPFTVEACIRQLRRQGVQCEVDQRHWSCVIARNR